MRGEVAHFLGNSPGFPIDFSGSFALRKAVQEQNEGVNPAS